MCPPEVQGHPEYRCKDCLSGVLLCRGCCSKTHQNHPFHRVEKFNGQWFEKTTLQEVGVVIQLGHADGKQCSSPAIAPRDALVMHTNGLHPVTLLFCDCDQVHKAGDRIEQSLRAELYPATLTDPSTFCTFRVLEQFHIHTLQSKVTVYDFYLALEKLTDNTGLGKRYVRVCHRFPSTCSLLRYSIVSNHCFVWCENGASSSRFFVRGEHIF